MESIKYPKSKPTYPFGRFVHQHGNTICSAFLFMLLTIGTAYIYLYILYDVPRSFNQPVGELMYKPYTSLIEAENLIKLEQILKCSKEETLAYYPIPHLTFELPIQRDFNFPLYKVTPTPIFDFYAFASTQVTMFAIWANNLYINAKLTFY